MNLSKILHLLPLFYPIFTFIYGSGSTKLLNTDPIWIRIHNTEKYLDKTMRWENKNVLLNIWWSVVFIQQYLCQRGGGIVSSQMCVCKDGWPCARLKKYMLIMRQPPPPLTHTGWGRAGATCDRKHANGYTHCTGIQQEYYNNKNKDELNDKKGRGLKRGSQ